jgi:hypothetical protein
MAPTFPLIAISLAAAWSMPGILGFWVGVRQRNLRLWSQIIPFGALVGVAAALGSSWGNIVFTYEGESLWQILSYPDTFMIFLPMMLIFFLSPAWLLYVSGALIGNSWQRRRTRRTSGTTPASPVSGTTQGAAQQPRKDLSPAKQAMLGWGGAIISALITLIGTIMFVK